MSLTEDMDPGASLELWRCNILPRMCLLLWDQTEWVMPPQSLQVDSGLPAFAYSRLGQICKACFTCQSLGLFELFLLLFSPDSFLSKQSRKKQKLKTVLLKKADCVCSAGVPFLGQMLGRIVKMDWGQAVVTVASCLPYADKLFYHLKETVLNPISVDSGTS